MSQQNPKSYTRIQPLKPHTQNYNPNHNFRPQQTYMPPRAQNQNQNHQSPQFHGQQQRNTFPTGPINVQPTQRPPQKLFTNAQVFGKPQNAWRSNPNKPPTFQPTPISGIPTNTNRPQHNYSSFHGNQNKNQQKPFFQRNGPANFTSEELFANEHEEVEQNSEQFYENFEENQYYNDQDYEQEIQNQDHPHSSQLHDDVNFQSAPHTSNQT
ncbi:hypothetical protein JTB14_021610 [Gonioctena quinquepunctata]|nr:hypothetical protein JTB14_021610 [Gonioctena quinquepunctata]